MTRPALTFTNPSKLIIPSKQTPNIFLPFKCTTTSTFNRVKTRPATPILLCSIPHPIPQSDIAQRSDEWFALRKDKLTTSSFSTALGFWQKNRRYELWHEKVFSPETLIVDPSARAAMNWGTVNESVAIEKYKSITGRDVGFLGFATHSDASSAWLGASPDGVLDPLGGILEVKCPYNKGKPELALPWVKLPYYYLPQVQGQMEIMDREWVEVYCWTSNGSSIFKVFRDREYWELISRILREFWFGNVIPAREAVGLRKGIEIPDLKRFEPEPKHELTNLVLYKSRKLASEAKLLCKDIAGHVQFFK
ncbi:hypothetical protein LUZ60_007780 [Juncus effusus]|nr:hypothetical protein LUZ60_007780 [Juncus effusus]